MSSDFSYEDILKWQVDDYDYTRVGQGACPAGTCTIVDAKPRNRYSSYTLLKVYYDDGYRISKIDYFASSPDKPRKTLVLSGYVRQGAQLAAVPFGDDQSRDGDLDADRLVRLPDRHAD